MRLNSVEVEDLTNIKGVSFPRGERFRQIIITGPPCSGKSTLVNALRGWPEEGYLDLAHKGWWRSRILTYRPREVHFGFPFKGFEESHAVFDREWLKEPSTVELKRVYLPPEKRWFFSANWRRKYVFDFQLLPPNLIFNVLMTRAKSGTHPVDAGLTEALVIKQVKAYEKMAMYFHQSGLRVYIRRNFAGRPRRITAGGTTPTDDARTGSLSGGGMPKTGT